MPCRFEILERHDLVRVVCEGVVEIRELVDLVDALDADPAFHPTIDDFLDLRRVTEIRIDAETGRKLTDLIRGLSFRANRSKRIAIVATGEPALCGARTFQAALSENPAYRIEVFDSPELALAFLDKTDPALIREFCRESVTVGLD